MDSNWRFRLVDAPDSGTNFDFPEVSDLAKTRVDEIGVPVANFICSPSGHNCDAISFAQPNFDDHDWHQLDLPHDWAVELPFDQTANVDHGFKPIGPGFPANNIGWYRRAFELPAIDKGRTLWLEFDGVYRNCIVWLNGHCLGRHVSGYSSFEYDINRYANFGGKNVLAVRVDASRFEGWFYEGAGIYRHVWLVKTSPLHVAHWGTYVTSQINGPKAEITVRIQLRNDAQKQASCAVSSVILNSEGKTVSQTIRPLVVLKADADLTVTQNLTIPDAKLWSPESPSLYRLVTTVKHGSAVADVYDTPFGVRSIHFDPDQGFLLNGKPYLLKGTCNHQDHAGVGAAIPDALEYYRVAKLKEMGANAYRTSHNTPTPELLDACDRLGMLVMDENRRFDTNAQTLADLDSMILRDRNHPSVFLWSIGNEEKFIQSSNAGAAVAIVLQNRVHELDPSRPVTYAANNGAKFAGVNSVIEVRGWNYNLTSATDDYHRTHPAHPNVGTEQGSTVGTRGIYASDKTLGYVSAYDENDVNPKRGGGRTAARWWNIFAARRWLSGGFIWTGFDYRGEPTPYKWPCISSHFGVMDTCGFPKDNFYYYQSWWSDKTVLHLLPHWNWPGKDGQDIDVNCFSNCEEVELFLNGESLGRKNMPLNGSLKWTVEYAPGTLSAKGYRGGKVVAQTKVETTGAPAVVKLEVDRSNLAADERDVSIVTVSVTDSQGRPVPTADNLIRFTLQGPGKIIGVGNGDPSSHEPDKSNQRKLFCGLAQVIIQSPDKSGEGRFTAAADGLQPATLTFALKPSQQL